MSVTRGACRLRDRAAYPRSTRGFSLLAAFLGLVALGLAIAVGLVEFRKFKHTAARDQFVAELKVIAKTFEDYRGPKGEFAPGTHPEMRVPKGMETVLAKTAWSLGPPFGGTYDWIPPQLATPPLPPAPKLSLDPDAPALTEAALTTPKPEAKPVSPPRPGMIAISAFSPARPLSLTEADLRYIDEQLDDGNLSTGRFRTGFNRWPVYLVNSRP